MTQKEFKETVDDAVANGADRKDAETYVAAGFKLHSETADVEAKTAKRKKTKADKKHE